MFGQVRVALAFRNNAFEVGFARKSEQFISVSLHVIAVQQAFTPFRHYPAEPKFPLNQGKVTSILTIAESPRLFLIICFGMLVPKQVETHEVGLALPEQQIPKLRLPLRVKANDFAIEYAAAALQVAS
jgi:hypothetical protein